jgi:hypothetical protein
MLVECLLVEWVLLDSLQENNHRDQWNDAYTPTVKQDRRCIYKCVSFIHFLYLFIRSFIHSFLYPSMEWILVALIHAFIHSFIRMGTVIPQWMFGVAIKWWRGKQFEWCSLVESYHYYLPAIVLTIPTVIFAAGDLANIVTNNPTVPMMLKVMASTTSMRVALR